MIRTRRPGEVRLMAAKARGRKRRVVVVDVALRTRNRGVRSRQWKRSIVVIERGLRPRGRVMTRLAGRREP